MRNLIIENDKGHYEFVDFVKGFAILTIVLMHYLQGYVIPKGDFLFKAVSFGGTGVHAFLFCSGFGLYYSWLHKKSSFWIFMKKRFTKVYFPYIIIVLISYFLPYMYRADDRLEALLSHVFLYKMFTPRYEYSFGAQFWFVSTILQFYFFFLPICKLKEKIGKFFIPFCVVVSLVWSFIVMITGNEGIRVWNSFFLQYLWEFACGMSLAQYIYKKRELVIPKNIIIISTFMGLLIEGIFGLAGGIYKLFNDIPALVGYLSLISIIYCFDSKFINKQFTNLFKISYELFLVHMLIIETIFHFVGFKKGIHNFLLSAISLIASIIVAILYKKITLLVYKSFNNTRKYS